jgi:hypothetical protein
MPQILEKKWEYNEIVKKRESFPLYRPGRSLGL